MPSFSFASTMLQQEARGLLTRLARVRPFVLVEPMLTAAAPLPHTQSAIDGYLLQGRKRLLNQVHEYLRWLESEQGQAASPETAQRRFTLLKLRFNAVVTQFDMFSNAITQRSENEFGVWLAGLDVVAADALALPPYFDSPPVLCYLDKGIGAAIRRARTRLPGGGDNPVALVRMPRERMIGSGIASSLVHEVGHQAAALLDLVAGLREEIKWRTADLRMGQYWARWISEIVADFWSVARVGVASTLGLIGVVSLPRPFVFRENQDDPHPMPWIRVHLSAAIGASLFPHPQWARVAALWDSYYPPGGLDAKVAELVEESARGDSQVRRSAHGIPPAGVARPFPAAGDELAAAAAGAAVGAAHGLARGAFTDVSDGSQPDLRRSWPGAYRWPVDAGRGKHDSGEAFDPLGVENHAGYVVLLRLTG